MPVDQAKEVLIIGGGLAGLACARQLAQASVPFRLFESSERVGGRIKTDEIEGFKLDRGFQVLLTSYPEANRVMDMRALDLQAFLSGALVRVGGKFHELADPWRRPGAAFASLWSPVGSFPDKLRIARFRARCLAGSPEQVWKVPEQPTHDALRAAGFSRSILERFFRPFLGGVFLDRSLATSSRMLQFVFRMFSQGEATLPAEGMEAIPRQLAASIDQRRMQMNARVDRIAPGQITLATGEVVRAAGIVVAVDGMNAKNLLDPIASRNCTISAQARGVICHYFIAPKSPNHRPLLYLNGEGHGPINNLCFPTSVAPTYAPPQDRGRKSLVSVAVMENASVKQEPPENVMSQLRDWFGQETKDWRHLRSYEIPYALPDQAAPALAEPQRTVRYCEGIYVCGDHRDNASINGALESGRRAAEAVIKDQL